MSKKILVLTRNRKEFDLFVQQNSIPSHINFRLNTNDPKFIWLESVTTLTDPKYKLDPEKTDIEVRKYGDWRNRSDLDAILSALRDFFDNNNLEL